MIIIDNIINILLIVLDIFCIFFVIKESIKITFINLFRKYKKQLPTYRALYDKQQKYINTHKNIRFTKNICYGNAYYKQFICDDCDMYFFSLKNNNNNIWMGTHAEDVLALSFLKDDIKEFSDCKSYLIKNILD